MRILFIQGGSRLKQAEDGTWYTDQNFNEDVWNRYVSVADSLTILLRRESRIYKKEEAEKRFNRVQDDLRIRVVPLPDFAENRFNMLNPFLYMKIKRIINEEVANIDKCFIRSISPYAFYTYEACKKYGKPYLFEACDFAKESYVMHSAMGRLIAGDMERKHTLLARDAAFATYVTGEALQKRYPCATGKMIGVSNVQLTNFDDSILTRRIERIKNRNSNSLFRIGTAAFLDVKWKGQELVIRALGLLKQKGITNVQYELIGIGSGDYLKQVAKECNVEDQVKIIGSIPHNKVFDWLDSLDVYVQSSYQEGLCRAIIEAMSRALPVVCSDAGGNYELIDRNFIFDCGDYQTLCTKLLVIQNHLPEQAERNYLHSKDYEKKVLDKRRHEFFMEFINS